MLNFLDANIIKKVLPVFIFFFAFALRVYGINWDQNQHLHPDERFLTMTTDAMVWPESLAEYLSPSISKLNPYNLGTAFYVYGTLPTTIVKYFSDFELFDVYQYNNIAITGRLISAIFDVGVVVLVYLISKNIFGRKTALLSAFLYSISVLPIQLSHFFAVDTFLNFFLVLSFYFLIRLIGFDLPKNHLSSPAGSEIHIDSRLRGNDNQSAVSVSKNYAYFSIFLGFSFGAALACKISALYFLPVILLGYFFHFLREFFMFRHSGIVQNPSSKPLDSGCASLTRMTGSKIFCLSTICCLLSTVAAAYVAARILDSHVFTGNLFPPELSPQFIKNIKELQTMGVRGSTFPPAIQWQSITPIIFPLKNIVLWGLGLPLGILSVIAVIYKIVELFIGLFKTNNLKSFYNNLIVKEFNSLLILFWILFLFFYQAIQPTPSMRYFLPIYPFLAILSANFTIRYAFPLFKKTYLLSAIYYLLLLIYPISFLSIYSRPHSRVMASEWIYQNIPQGETLSCDAWDDCLPLSLGEGKTANQYNILSLEPFVPDDPQKIDKYKSQLDQIDYLIFSSNRAWGSLPQWPEKFPYMIKFYEDLFADKSTFQKVAEITSYPKLKIGNWEFEICDDLAEEAFTVYDHPKVLIYKNEGRE